MLNVVYEAFQIIARAFVDLYVLMVCLRILFRWANVNYANPILIAIARMTYPLLRPIYSIIPTFHGIDLASVILLSVLSMAKIAMLAWLQTGYIPMLKGLFILAFSAVLKQFIDIFFIVIILVSLMSWLTPMIAPALAEIVFKMGMPLLRLVQKVLPPIANIDFSPFFVILGLQLLTLFIVNPLAQIGLVMIKTTLVPSP